jgi:hypothetical protein
MQVDRNNVVSAGGAINSNVHTAERNNARIHPGVSSAFPITPEAGRPGPGPGPGPQIERQQNPNVPAEEERYTTVRGFQYSRIQRPHSRRSRTRAPIEYRKRNRK